MAGGITRFLVSGSDEQLQDFHFAVCFMLNGIERRGETVFYTSYNEDRDQAIEEARRTGVTMQEIEFKFKSGKETYKMLVQGEHPGWNPKKRERKNGRDH